LVAILIKAGSVIIVETQNKLLDALIG